MNKSKFASLEDLPVMMMVSDVANVLGIGLTKAYEIARRNDFPAFYIGTRIIVPRDEFISWIRSKTIEKSSNYI